MSDQANPTPPPIAPPPAPMPPPPPPPNLEAQARTWNMLCHLSALSGYVIPFGHILGPLIVWQIKKNEFPSVDVHGKAALNFQITVTLALVVSAASAVVLSFFCIGWLLFPVVAAIGLAGLVLAIIAGIKANNGEVFHYPCTIEFVK